MCVLIAFLFILGGPYALQIFTNYFLAGAAGVTGAVIAGLATGAVAFGFSV